MVKKKHDDNQWPPPTPGLEFDLEGPTADHLLDTSDIYDQPVYQRIHAAKEEWDIVTKSDAEPYLPIRKEPLKVNLGVQEKKTIELNTFSSTPLSDYLQYKKGFVINTGSSIWGLDFAPKLASVESDPFTQYLAVGGYRGSVEEHVGMEEFQPTGSYKNCIQIWKLKLSVTQTQEEPKLDLCLLHDYGVIYDMKWCPYGTYEEEDHEQGLAKLGILSFACGDGTIRTIVVPHPNSVRKQMLTTNNEEEEEETVYLKIKSPRCTFAIKGTNFMNLAWGGHKRIATGCNYGNVIVWDMVQALSDNQPKDSMESKRCLQLTVIPMDASVRSLTWNGHRDPERLVIAGYDGKLVLVDMNDPFVPLLIARSRNVMNACAWNSHEGPLIFVDGEKIARGFAFNEDGTSSMFIFGDVPGFCWTCAISENHGQIAFGTSIGWLRSGNMYQLRSRKLLINQSCIYKLDYFDATKTYRYIDGIGQQTQEEIKKLPQYQLYGASFMAIQKAVWNPNKRTSAFIASGGAAGLCRIEFEGRGSKWE